MDCPSHEIHEMKCPVNKLILQYFIPFFRLLSVLKLDKNYFLTNELFFLFFKSPIYTKLTVDEML